MSWEQRLFGLFEDLEQQAEGLALVSRDAAVEELARAGYSEVDLGSRLHASVGLTVQLVLKGAGQVRGRLARVGAGWCLMTPEAGVGQEWVVSLPALVAARGLSARAVPEPARSVVTRLRLGSVLRGLSEEAEPLAVLTVDGEQRRGRILRVGADFLELAPAGGVEVLPFTAVALVRRL
jgi:hypothetical protein